jgi:two-component system sensor histidine kinase SenX3
VALFEDITERVRVEAVRRDFVANVSHELKTPVGAISLLAEALEGERDPEVVERLTGRIGNEARRVSGLVEDLLDLRSIEEGDVGGATTVDLVEVAAEVLERVEPLAQRRGVSLEAELPASAEVIGIHTQLLSLLRNLVENGVKYSDTGGSVQLNISKNGNEIVVRVTDRGMGIPQRDHDRVFERFYRVDRARTRDTGGSGLGLSIVRNVVQGHRGNVELTSQEGEGTTVTVRLPIGLVPPEADH